MKLKVNYIEKAQKIFDIEIKALNLVKNSLDDSFNEIIDCILSINGKLIITGIGKSGHIGKKIASTLSSLGTPSIFLHPAEAQHGDLGIIQPDDIVIAISYSGESEEVTKLIPNIKMIGAKLIGITGNNKSKIALNSEKCIVLPKFKEAEGMNLAPSSSTTAILALGDAMAICVSKEKKFKEKNFALYHPAGILGKKLLLKVKDIMHSNNLNASVNIESTLIEAIIEMSSKSLGMINIIDNGNILKGIFTDGDLRRLSSKATDFNSIYIKDIMTKNPIFINEDILITEALKIMKSKTISVLPVLKNKKLVGSIRLIDIIQTGIYV